MIFENVEVSGTTSLPLENLRTEVLRESFVADRPYPPFHRVAMDGVAISLSAWEKGMRSFRILGCQKAGAPQENLAQQECCLEVMTGSVLPEGCDAVIRYEDIQIENGLAHIRADLSVESGMNVHGEGSDYQKGNVLLKSGCVLRSPGWAVGASIGQTSVEVSRRPKIALVSTGDELVPVSESPKAHQIRQSNSYAFLSALRVFGFEDVRIFHVVDEPKEIIKTLEMILSEFGVLVLSGGVSMGRYDFIPRALADLHVKEIFHKVRQKPGKPLWFGKGKDKQLVFGLPGNPVSSLICLYRYVLPALRKSLGLVSEQRPFAVLEKDIQIKNNLTYFQPVQIRYGTDGRIYAWPVDSNGSGDFASLSLSAGFVELPEGPRVCQKNEAFPLYLWGE